ncbi:MAG TPA: acyltransferase [Candidatus Saccharimonadia bacterium]|nr:acyltransferase [Candidatus Saccharimonadia bacterium]
MAQTLAERLKGRQNNFDLLRFVAAGLVIVSHSFALAGYPEPMVGKTTLGTLAVAIFFIMSGFLIAQSWVQHPRMAAFLGKRVLRIVPGLAGVLVFSVFVLGPAFTSLTRQAYFASADTFSYLNGIFIYTIGSMLPGVFAGNPLGYAINGSLWTLPYEFTAYLLVALLSGLALLRRHRAGWIVVFALFLPLNYVLRRWAPELHLPFFNLDVGIIAHLTAYFVGGTLLYVFRQRVRLSAGLAWAALAVFAVSSAWPLAWLYLSYLTLPYLIIYLAFMQAGRLANFGRYGDFSYGLYIYAFPVQQALVAGTPGISPLRLMALAFPITLALAICSWHLIEAPALRLKRYFGTERYPLLQPQLAYAPQPQPTPDAEPATSSLPLPTAPAIGLPSD